VAGVDNTVEIWSDNTPVGASNPMPVSVAVSVPRSGALTDRSGTITTGGTSQQVMAANTNRKYLLIQNESTGDLWINFGVAAVIAQPSIRLGQWDAFVMEEGFISTQALNVIGATTAQAFTAKEG
jgi:hypothetical protein